MSKHQARAIDGVHVRRHVYDVYGAFSEFEAVHCLPNPWTPHPHRKQRSATDLRGSRLPSLEFVMDGCTGATQFVWQSMDGRPRPRTYDGSRRFGGGAPALPPDPPFFRGGEPSVASPPKISALQPHDVMLPGDSCRNLVATRKLGDHQVPL